MVLNRNQQKVNANLAGFSHLHYGFRVQNTPKTPDKILPENSQALYITWVACMCTDR